MILVLPKRFRILSGIILVAIVLGGVFLLNRPESAADIQTTDDAYVHADTTFISSRVSGSVVDVRVEDDEAVEAGELLAIIDDRDLVIAVDRARADVLRAQSEIDSLKARLHRQETEILQGKAVVDADDASIVLAQTELKRYRNLAADGSGTLQALQRAETELRIRQAEKEKDMAAWEAAKRQVDILKADLQKAQAIHRQAEAQLAAAELNLSYSRIVAPVSGIVSQRTVRLGAYVHTGEPLLAIVPLQTRYIRANFRETQLARMRTGQPVSIRVDALPGVMLKGHVESLGAASGASFSPIAPHNATGNFTKIVQRLPVRIALDPGQDAADRLRVGMSVQPAVDVGHDGVQSAKMADDSPKKYRKRRATLAEFSFVRPSADKKE